MFLQDLPLPLPPPPPSHEFSGGLIYFSLIQISADLRFTCPSTVGIHCSACVLQLNPRYMFFVVPTKLPLYCLICITRGAVPSMGGYSCCRVCDVHMFKLLIKLGDYYDIIQLTSVGIAEAGTIGFLPGHMIQISLSPRPLPVCM